MTEIEESGRFDVRKLRSGGVWMPVSVIGAVAAIAVAWGTNATRLSTLEKQQTDAQAERQRIEDHLQSTDGQVIALREQLRYIIEQLRQANEKLDRLDSEQERHR